MRRLIISTASILLLSFATLAGTAAAQVPAPAPPQRDRPAMPPPMPAGTGVIKGRVVDSQSGGAVARARVRLNWMGPGLQRPPATTDDSGGFAFTGLPPGGFMLNVDKSTYMAARYPEAGQTMRTMSKPLTLADGQTIDNVTVMLYHGGAIAGRVVDAHGDPMESAQVQALRLPKTGRGKPQQRGGGSTNDLGEFRLARLEPGKYLVVVMPQRRDMMMFGPMPDVGEAQQPVPTFYPGVTAMDQAQPIAVERGASTMGVEIALVDAVTALVSGTLVDASRQLVTRNGSIGVRPIIKDVPGGFGMNGTSVRPDGTFQLRLPPGEYEIEGHAMANGFNGPPPPGSEQFGSVRLTVSADVTGLTIPLGAGATVTGRIVFDGTSPLPTVPSTANANGPGPGRLMFTSSDGAMCRSGRSDLGADWTFSVEGVFGTCTARFSAGLGRWIVKAITHDGKDLLDQPISFTAGQAMRDVEVILTDKRTELTLHVADEHGNQTREYVALMFSADKARWTENSRYLRTYMPPSEQMPALSGQLGAGGVMSVSTSANGVVVTSRMVADTVSEGVTSAPRPSGQPAVAPGGSTARKETISAMPPGDYFVVALDDIEGESTRDFELLQQLARGATRVRVSDTVPADVSLRRLKLSDIVR